MLALLKPKRKERVFDLVERTGFDVSDWVHSVKTSPIKANPKYCYRWAFDDGNVIILSLWHDMMHPEGDKIVHRHSFRPEHSGNLEKASWRKRATEMDEAVQRAKRMGMPIRVIINDGVRRNKDMPGNLKTKVEAKELDSNPWFVEEYDARTGTNLLRRG